MCGGFTCSKNALIALNVLYIVVAFVLIGVAVYGRAATLVTTNLPIVGGILACGIILMLISVLGLLGAVKHHQVMLFFYMVILFLLFLIQFSVACACLGVNSEQQIQLAEEGWKRVHNDTRSNVQEVFNCCGFDEKVNIEYPPPNSTSIKARVCADPSMTACSCPNCMEKLQSTINYAFQLCGWIGLFFSFSEIMLGKILTSQAQELVLNLYEYFELEKRIGGPLEPLFSVQEIMLGKILITSQAQELVLNLYEYFELEKRNGVPLEPLFSVQELVGLAWTRHYRNLHDPDELRATAVFPRHNFTY